MLSKKLQLPKKKITMKSGELSYPFLPFLSVAPLLFLFFFFPVDCQTLLHCWISFRVMIEHTHGEGPGAYVSATISKKIPETTPEVHTEVSDTPADSDSDSSE